MDLHEELERRAHQGSRAAAERLGAPAAGDALVALVGRRRRRRTATVTGVSAACVAAVVGGVAYAGPWTPSPVEPAAVTTSGQIVIDATTPLADAPFSFPRYAEKAPLTCGEDYAVPSGATRQVDDASRWPLTVTASAAVMRSGAGALGLGEDLLTWTAEVGPRAAVEDLAFTAYAVVEHDGRVAASKPLAGQEPAGGGVLDALHAPVPGLCGGTVANTYPDDGDYTFHLWVQLVDGTGAPVATVIDPVAPVTLTVTGIADYWNSSTTFNGYPNLSLAPIKCGDPSFAEGRLWDDAGYSEMLPDGVTMPGWSASLGEGEAPLVTTMLDAPLTSEESFAIAQAFGVVDGVVVAVGDVRAASNALNYSASLDLSSPCGVSVPSSMDVYVLQEALIADGSDAPPVKAAVLLRLDRIDVVPGGALMPSLDGSYLAGAGRRWSVSDVLRCDALAIAEPPADTVFTSDHPAVPIPAWLETGRLYGWGEDALVGGYPIPLISRSQPEFDTVLDALSEFTARPAELNLVGAGGVVWGFSASWSERDDLPHDEPGLFVELNADYGCNEGIPPEGVYEARLSYVTHDGTFRVAELDPITVVNGVPSLPLVDAAGR